MFNIKGQDGGIYKVSNIYPKQYTTYNRMYFFIMGDDHILGIFRTERSCNRVLRNFLTWCNAESSNTVIFTIAQDDSSPSYTPSAGNEDLYTPSDTIEEITQE